MIKKWWVNKKKDRGLIPVTYVPSACRVRSEFEIILGEFGQCCHHRFVLGCFLIHEDATVEHGAKIRIEHGVVWFVHGIIITMKMPLMGQVCSLW